MASRIVLVTKSIPIDSRYFAFFSGVRLKTTYTNDVKQDVTPTEELIPLLEDTVLHNLLYPEDKVVFQSDLGAIQNLRMPIPPLGSIFDLEVHSVYDEAALFVGTSIRLPNIHAGVNSVVAAINKGLTPDYSVIYKSYMGSMKTAIDERLLCTRVPLGFNAPAMGGDGFLKPGEIAVTTALASEFIENTILNIRKSTSKVEGFKRQYISMANNLKKRFDEHGPGILNGLTDVVGKREPATSYGTLKRYTLRVVDIPGKAIYITTPDIHGAGGDFDGKTSKVTQ